MNGGEHSRCRAIAAAIITAFATFAHAAESPSTALDVANLSIEELRNLPVTTFSKREEKLSEVPGALYVITQDEIRRSGALTIPEALRMAPGLQVAQVDAHTWAISARGFNEVFANKLLVLQDGRSIYTPLFSGVFWDVQDTMLEDIDRIEVIRGPGATLWGANAVNGVINIITKRARETQGFLLSGGAGTEETGFGGLRYGGRINDEAHFRVYGKYFDRGDSAFPDGDDARDGWRMARGGFRVDWEPSDQNILTFQGDIYGGRIEQIYTRVSPSPPYPTNDVPDRFDVNGGNLLGRWTHTISEESTLALQAYYDRTLRDIVIFREVRDTLDADFQHRFQLGARHDLIWGGGYRWTHDDVRETDNFDVSLNPSERGVQLFSAFAQDEIALVHDRLSLTLGSKFEHNDFTGFEWQPGARLLWTPGDKHTLWGAVSRAVRTPSRTDHDVRLNQHPVFGGGSLITSIRGYDGFESETLIAYELGYRVQPHRRVSLDFAAFYNDYDELRGVRSEGVQLSPSPPHVALLLDNVLEGETYGGEIAARFEVADWWRWRAAYSYLQMQMHPKTAPADSGTERDTEGNSPHHQFSVASGFDLPFRVGLDATVRYVDELPALDIDSYVALDLRLSWRPVKNLEVALVGLNLLDDRHPEFRPMSIRTQQTEVQRSFYGKVTWRF